MGKTAIFQLSKHYEFMDTAQILCYMHKINRAEFLSLLKAYSTSPEGNASLENCPEFSYRGSADDLYVSNLAETAEEFMVKINFKSLQQTVRLRNGQTGRLYYVYAETKPKPTFWGQMIYAPENSIKAKRIPMVLVPSP